MPSRHAATLAMSTPAPKEIYNKHVYITALVASMGAFIFGYDLAFIGTTITLTPFKRDFGLLDASQSTTDSFSANIVSLLQAGCFFGSLAVAPLGDKYGRKPALITAGAAFCTGSLIQTLSYGVVAAMLVGRAIGGLGVGLASGIVPLFIAELAPPAIRYALAPYVSACRSETTPEQRSQRFANKGLVGGRLVGIYEISVQAGTCIGFWICYGVKQHMAETPAQWITPFAIQLVPGGLLVIGMLFVTESPRWLAQHRSRNAASQALMKLRNLQEHHPYLQEELAHIMMAANDISEASGNGGLISHWKKLRVPSNRKRIFIGITVFVFMQFAGSNAINYYSPRIFASVGLTGSSTSLYATGIYGIVRLVCVIIAMHFFVDRFGRKNMLIGGAVVMLVAMWYIGAYIKIANPEASSGLTAGAYAAITFIYVFAVAFCFSYAGIPWIVCSELYDLHIRGIGVAITTASHWLFNFVIARSVPYMVSNIGYGTYFVFASFITLSIPFVYFCLPETKGLSLEEINALFDGPENMDTINAALEEAKGMEDVGSVHVEHSRG